MFVVLIVSSSILAIGCFVMAGVFSYMPWIAYPAEIVNVFNTNSIMTFYMRCDIATNTLLKSYLLQVCCASRFSIHPECNTPSLNGYWNRVYTIGQLKCPLENIDYIRNMCLDLTTKVNLNINLVAFASSMMIIGGISFLILIIIIMKNRYL